MYLCSRQALLRVPKFPMNWGGVLSFGDSSPYNIYLYFDELEHSKGGNFIGEIHFHIVVVLRLSSFVAASVLWNKVTAIKTAAHPSASARRLYTQLDGMSARSFFIFVSLWCALRRERKCVCHHSCLVRPARGMGYLRRSLHIPPRCRAYSLGTRS